MESVGDRIHVDGVLPPGEKRERCEGGVTPRIRALEPTDLETSFAGCPRIDDRALLRLLRHGDFGLRENAAIRRRVDPHRGRQRPRRRAAIREPLRVPRERFGQHTRALFALRFGKAVVDILRRKQPEPDVVMFGVVPGEEVLAMLARVLDRTEALGEVRPVLHGLELRLRVRARQ